MCQAEFLETVLYSQKARREFSEYTYLLRHIPKSWRSCGGLEYPDCPRIIWVRLSVEARRGDRFRCPFGPSTPNEIAKHHSHSGSIV